MHPNRYRAKVLLVLLPLLSLSCLLPGVEAQVVPVEVDGNYRASDRIVELRAQIRQVESSADASLEDLARLRASLTALDAHARRSAPGLDGATRLELRDLRIRVEALLRASRPAEERVPFPTVSPGVPHLMLPESSVSAQVVTLSGADSCADAPTIGAGTYSGTLVGATPDGSASCDFVDGAADVWYRYEVPGDEVFVIGSSDEMKMHVSFFESCGSTGVFVCATAGADGVVRSSSSYGGSGWIRVSGAVGGEGAFQLKVGTPGKIEGRVTDEVSGAPLADRYIETFPGPGGAFRGLALTDVDGRYAIGGLSDGFYRVRASGEGTVDELFEDVECAVGDHECLATAGDPVEVTLGATTRVDMKLGVGGVVTGRVVEGDTGQGLVTPVEAINRFGFTEASTRSAADGTYRLEGLPSGEYRIQAYGDGRYVSQVWNGADCPSLCGAEDGDAVSVPARGTVPNINFSLSRLGRASGTVRDAQSGAPLDGVRVEAHGLGEFSDRQTYTDGSGRFEFGDLMPDTYTFTAEGERHLQELYPEILCPATVGQTCDPAVGQAFAVDFEGHIQNLDFTLSPGGSLSGRVTHALTGQALGNVEVEALQSGVEHEAVLGRSMTDAAGRYRIDGLLGGPYLVRTRVIFSGDGIGVDVLYPGIPCGEHTCPLASGTAVDVVLEQETAGVDLAVRGFGSLSGRVTESAGGASLAGLTVTAEPAPDQPGSFASTTTDSQGHFLFEKLFPGIYVVRARSESHIEEVFDDVVCGRDLPSECVPQGDPTWVTVEVEKHTPNIDFELDRGGRIGGLLVDRQGAPLTDVSVDVYDAASRRVDSVQFFPDAGRWQSRALPPGTYFAHAQGGQNRPSMAWNNRFCEPNCPQGDPIQLGAGNVTGIDFSLPRFGLVRGEVVDAETAGAVGGAVSLWSSDGERVTEDALLDGSFVIGFLPAGTYYLMVDTDPGYPDAVLGGGLCYDDGCDPLLGTGIVVEYDGTVEGLSIALPRGGQIAGTLKGAGGEEISAGSVSLFDSQGRKISSAQAYGDSWIFRGVPAGSYYLVGGGSSSHYARVWGGGRCAEASCDPLTGTPITVTGGGLVGGLSFELDELGSLGGRVTRRDSGAPLNQVALQLRNADGSVRATRWTDAQGRYDFHQFEEGPFYLTIAAGSAWIPQAWPGIPCPRTGCDPVPAQAEPVTVPVATTVDGFDFALEADSGCGGAGELCLLGDRFRVSAQWASADGQGSGSPVALTASTGYFTFFSPSNVEILIKVLDGCAINGHYWVFAAGLTDLDVGLIIEDSVAGETLRVENPGGQVFTPVQNIAAFETCDVVPVTSPPDLVSKLIEPSVAISPQEAPRFDGCEPDEHTVCLTGGRFKVQMDWRTGPGAGSPATAVPLSSDTAYFWFFNADNIEALVKVLDACDPYGQIWIFTSGLTDVGTELTITDTTTGAVWTSGGEPGVPFMPVLDVAEDFACP